MFQAIAEKVSGKKVFANGTWLNCIGNKNVSVGDKIYTDGRCIYGFYKESQQPLVIFAPQDKDFGIPIMVYQSNYGKKFFYYFTFAHNELKFVGNKYLEKVSNPEYTIMINDEKSGVFKSKKVIAANIDKFGNFYKMKTSYSSENETLTVKLSKNDVDFYTIDFDENNFKLNAALGIDFVDLGVCCAYIENENDWAFILAAYASFIPITGDPYDALQGEGWENDPNYPESAVNWYVRRKNIIKIDLLFCTPKVEQIITDVDGAYYEYGKLNNGVKIYDEETVEKIAKYEGLTKIKIPIQDGFYYTIDEIVEPPADSLSQVLCAKISVHTSSGEIILTDYFRLFPKFTISQVSAGVFLIGVNFEEIPIPRYNYPGLNPIWINNGLYLCSNGKLNKIDSFQSVVGYYSKIGDLDCNILNQRLRNMSDYKNWANSIQDFV